MNIEGRKILVLGGYGLVGTAVCRELLARHPREIQIHSLRAAEAAEARAELLPEAGGAELTVSDGDLFGLVHDADRRARIFSQIGPLADEDLPGHRLYRVITEAKPDIVVDCINTATGIAYRDIFGAAADVFGGLTGGKLDDDKIEHLLEALYMPRLIRHLQLLYRAMTDAATRVYIKVGTSGTGGMGLNIPYTHSEERPSRVLLAKSAMAGAQSMLLFLMARTPGAPVTKEIKPSAAIAWKKIEHGPIRRKGKALKMVEARPQPLSERFSSLDPSAGTYRDDLFETAFIDTGENGLFSLEEFITVSSEQQMELVTPEEIARYLVYEIEGGNTGHDIVAALDGAILGPTYRAGLLRQAAIDRMQALEKQHGTHSVAFEMLGPARNSKLLFEAHLLRLAFPSLEAVRRATPEAVRDALDRLVREQPEEANRVCAVGIPLLLDSGEILRGPEVLVPSDAAGVAVTPEALESWVRDGWVDLRLANCAKWVERCEKIHGELATIPAGDTSSRFVRNPAFWDAGGPIQPGKIVGWILETEDKGWRFKR